MLHQHEPQSLKLARRRMERESLSVVPNFEFRSASGGAEENLNERGVRMAHRVVERTFRNTVHRPLRVGPGMCVGINHQPDGAGTMFAKAAYQPVQRGGQAGSIDIAVGKNMGDFPEYRDGLVEDSLNLVDPGAGGRAGWHLSPERVQVESGRGQKLSRFVVQRPADTGGFFLPLLEDLDQDLGQPRQEPTQPFWRAPSGPLPRC